MQERTEEGVAQSLSASVGDYLKAVWQLSAVGPAAPGDIARELGVSGSSVTAMLLRLQRDGLVDYVPYRGAELTPSGRTEALRLVRRHRLLETFLIRDLGFTWDEVHEEAERVEHAVSDRFTERLAVHLGQPRYDPHGDPIPRADGSMPDAPEVSLAGADVGSSFLVQRVLTQDSEALAHLALLGVAPGSVLTVVAREPVGRLLTLRSGLGEEPFALSHDLAMLVMGEAAR